MTAATWADPGLEDPHVHYDCAYQILLVRCSPLLLVATSLAHRVYRNRVPNRYTPFNFFPADAASLSSILHLASSPSNCIVKYESKRPSLPAPHFRNPVPQLISGHASRTPNGTFLHWNNR
jgi:hypothetical protein